MLRSLPLVAVALLSVEAAAQGAAPVASPTPAVESTPAPAASVAPSPPPTPVPTPTPPLVPLSEDERRAVERNILLVAQTVMAAERMYASANRGLFDQLRCLGTPWECIPGFSADAASFLDASYDWLEPRLGYARRFHAGPAATPQERNGASPTSLRSYAFTLTPQRQGNGLRAFCVDSKGRLCVREDGLEAPVKNGLCDPCRKLE
jgi:hypothetical protein